ncbi:MAG: hypothetical protein JEZ04_11615 [Spirochaetales bacterium]|nr:hypothetical protein [Spirochaetales bacterium]
MSYQFWIAIGLYVISIVLFKFILHIKRKHLQDMAMWCMIAGIVFLCQPLSAFLFHYGIGVLGFGLLWWNIANNSKPDEIIES